MILSILLAGMYQQTDNLSAAGTITGTAFRDFNLNAAVDAGEPGIYGIVVTAYDATGTNQGSATTAADGTYTLNATGTGPYRIEFTFPADGSLDFLQPSLAGNTTVQFVADGAQTANAGFYNPADYYVEANTNLATNFYRNGQSMTGYATDLSTIVGFSYDKSGLGMTGANAPDTLATVSEVGATWGLAYQRSNSTLYSSALLKRHAGLYEDPIGTPHLGAIFATDTTAPSTQLFVDLADLGVDVGTIPSNVDRSLPTTANGNSTDAEAFDKVGKTGLGDIDISDDESDLWVMSLNDKTLYQMAIDSDNNPATAPTAADLTAYPLPTDACAPFEGLRIWAGSLSSVNRYTDGEGRTWSGDEYPGYGTNGSGSNNNDTIANVNNPLDNTSDEALYQRFRAGVQVIYYDIPVPNATYTVRLHFVEPSNTSAGARQFDILLEGTNVAAAYDIFAAAGARDRAQTEEFSGITVSDGILNLVLDSASLPGQAAISGIEILPESTIPSGELRPFATTYHDGQVYVGAVCDAQASQNADDLQAIVYRLDGASFTNILDFPLDYTKGDASAFLGSCDGDDVYYPWTSVFPQHTCSSPGGAVLAYPQPVLSDIEFDVDGSMILGFFDRMGHQSGTNNVRPDGTGDLNNNVGGDLLRAYNNNGVYELESNATAGPVTTAGAGTAQGPGGGEFYFEESFFNNGDFGHEETSNGGLALLPSTGDVVVTLMDPVDGTNVSGGVGWMDNTTGAKDRAYNIYRSDGTTPGTFSKSAGLGDVELLHDPAPTEIGNRVWHDANGNGIQDPDEDGIADVTVELWADTDDNGIVDTLVGTATTDASGNYLFGGLTDANMSIGSIEAKTAYELRIDTSQAAITTPSYALTTANAAQPAAGNASATDNDNVTDVADSDAAMTGADAVIALTTSIAGTNNHGLDFGFLAESTEPVAVGSYVWNDVDGDGIQDAGEPAIAGATVRLLDGNGNPALDMDGKAVMPQITGSDGLYYFDNLATGDYIIDVMPPSGYAPTVYEADPNTDVASDSNGVPLGGGSNSVRSGIITLTNDGEPIEVGGFAGDDQDDLFDDNNGNMTVDFGFYKPAAVGNFIWLDENSDGLQDEGETGIANVVVQLKDSSGTVIATTVTDSEGGYLFADLPPGNYFVDVDESSLPAGMSQTTVTNNSDSDGDGVADDADFGNKNHSGSGYAVSLVSGEENLTADFGYNHNPTDHVTAPTGSPVAALGDRVWIDTNGDGVQDTEEVGVEGVQLTLFSPGPDGLFGTADDVNEGTTTTDEQGNYLFDNLTPGAYVVEVTSDTGASHDVLTSGNYDQTGDPDDFGKAATNPDNKSTVPVILGPGDVFLNVDFGYQPTGAVLNSVGDTVYFDADLDGNGPLMPAVDGGADVMQGAGGAADTADYGIAGVTVALIDDLDGDGIWDSGEPIIATEMTDAKGQYLFTGLPDGNYLVAVTDTQNILAGLNQSYDSDGVAGSPNVSAVDLDSAGALPTAVNDRVQDFGYGPSEPVGIIGDTVWYDVDGSGGDQATQGAEPGIAGVTVNLYADTNGDGLPDDVDGDGSITSTDIIENDVTDSNGNYLFENLPLGGYVVEVDTTTLPATFDPTSTYEPDGDNDGFGTSVTLTASTPADLDQDFSYTTSDTSLNSVGDTVFGDMDSSESDGTPDSGDVPLAGVTVLLTPPPSVDLGNGPGQPISTVTDENGNYLFTDLPDGAYTVDVDTSTLPAGWSPASTYDNDGGGDSSSVVDLDSGGASATGIHDRDQDFSYPPQSGSPVGLIGDTIWYDVDSSGGDESTQGMEPGLAGVVVTLTPPAGVDLGNGLGQPISTVTDENGHYLFDNLPLDDGVGGDPTYTIAVDTMTLPRYVSHVSTHDGTDGGNDSTSTATLSDADLANGSHMDLDQDFSYPPAQRGAIGDTVWFDSDGSTGATQDAGEPGLEGVVMELLDDSGNVIATTATDENGRYYFGDLPLDETYQVRVAGSNFASGGALEGMSPTYDPNDPTGNDNLGPLVTLTGANPINLDQDFSYTGFGSIGNRVWLDQNADGIWDGDSGTPGVIDTDDDEPGIAGVTIDLYRDLNGNGVVDPGEPMMGTAITDANGNYLFDNLPITGSGATGGAAYVVDVTDEAGVLNGYWHSLGTNGVYAGDPTADEQDHSKSDTVAVEIGGTQPTDNLNVDFGYYVEPAAVGNYVWLDLTPNGLQDPGELPIEGVEVQMVITYTDGATTTLVTVTDANGYYSFGNLLLDEDYATGSADNSPVTGPPAQPAHTIWIDPNQTALITLAETFVNTDDGSTATIINNDSNEHSGTAAQPVQGLTDTTLATADSTPVASYDFGYVAKLALGGTLWDDQPGSGDGTGTANDGIHQVGEKVLNGVTMKLYHANPDGTLGAPVEDPNNPGTDYSVVTGSDGAYLFDGLSAGDYIVVVENFSSQTSLPHSTLGSEDPDTSSGNIDTGSVSGTSIQSEPITLSPLDGGTADGSEPASERENDLLDGTLSASQDSRMNYHVDMGFTNTPLAVSLSYAYAQRSVDGTVYFIWEAIEKGNSGFNLYMEPNDSWSQPVNGELLPSSVIDSVAPTRYTYHADVVGERYHIEFMSVDGTIERHGPFDLGEEYGEPTAVDPNSLTNPLYLPLVESK
ncbi:MAG: hypothetical protein KDD92_03430 [Caldilineaceae bacterium]|nr:hypothetical protein [Caldilineaceae bacterium]